MGQVIYAYAFALLFLVNSVNTTNPVLVWLNAAAGIYMTVMGSIAGWFYARRD